MVVLHVFAYQIVMIEIQRINFLRRGHFLASQTKKLQLTINLLCFFYIKKTLLEEANLHPVLFNLFLFSFLSFPFSSFLFFSFFLGYNNISSISNVWSCRSLLISTKLLMDYAVLAGVDNSSIVLLISSRHTKDFMNS